MGKTILIPSLQSCLRGKFTLLFFSFVSLFLFFPFVFEKGPLMDVFFTLLLVSSSYAIRERRTLLFIALALVVIDLVMTWSLHLFFERQIDLWGIDLKVLFLINLSVRLLFFSMTTVLLLFQIMKQSRVTLDTIFGSFCVYLLIAIVWALIYVMLEMLSPKSFLFSNPEEWVNSASFVRESFISFLYFSLVTLTTLGYGDILPMSIPARTFASFEAVCGQLFLAVLVARLVGLHISSPPSSTSHDSDSHSTLPKA